MEPFPLSPAQENERLNARIYELLKHDLFPGFFVPERMPTSELALRILVDGLGKETRERTIHKIFRNVYGRPIKQETILWLTVEGFPTSDKPIDDHIELDLFLRTLCQLNKYLTIVRLESANGSPVKFGLTEKYHFYSDIKAIVDTGVANYLEANQEAITHYEALSQCHPFCCPTCGTQLCKVRYMNPHNFAGQAFSDGVICKGCSLHYQHMKEASWAGRENLIVIALQSQAYANYYDELPLSIRRKLAWGFHYLSQVSGNDNYLCLAQRLFTS